MKYKRSVYQSLVLVTQFGINMLVPIFMCSLAGVYIGKRFDMDWIVIPLFFMGALAGFQNVHKMAKKIYQQKEERKQNHVKKD